MLIMSQNKERLIDAADVCVQKALGGKKRSIIANRAGVSFEGSAIIGEYPDEEAAMREMDDITRFFGENPSGVYRMK